ncbi:hypothetical protein QFZ31_006659 [Neobacillus niacini]|uniref:DUF859 family phage minor structural protein n=1 Tax=Neobacillus driksii TaxID=3035913 RepID=UPI00277F84AF|nr:DUF859 family phage minor structural protein [Neobacillus niacini]MDQ0976607.1 hypothetical protein [Neobacillus niacini]
MASGSWNVTTDNPRVVGTVTWSSTENITGNYSDVTVTMRMERNNTGYTTYGTGTFWIKVNGTLVQATNKDYSWTYNSNSLVVTGTVRVNHNADGTKAVKIEWDGSGNSPINLNYGSGTATMDTIPRKSTLTDTTPSFTAGSDFTIAISRYSSSFTHRAYIDVLNEAGTWVNIKYVDFSTSQTSLSSAFSTTDKTDIFSYLNGRSSMSMRINLYTYSGAVGTGSLGYNTYSGTATAPLASTAKISNPAGVSDLAGQEGSTVWIDQATVGITMTRYDSEFTHTLRFKDGNTGAIIHEALGVTTAYTWTLTDTNRDALYSKIPDSVELDGQLDILTFYGGKQVRTTTNIDINYRVRNSAPIFDGTGVTYIDTNQKSGDVTGDKTSIVQNVSTVRVTIPLANKAKEKNKASIVNYIAILNGVQKTAPYSITADIIFDFGFINAGVDQTLTVKAVDSRGFETPVTKTVIMIPYQPPTLSGSAKRKNGFDNETTLLANGSISPVTIGGAQKNAVSDVKFRYRKTTEATTVSTWVYTSFAETVSGTTYVTPAVPLDLDNTYSYYVDFLVTDLLGSRLLSVTVGSGKPIFFIDALKKNVGVGKFPDSGVALDVDGSINAKSLRMTDEGGTSREILKAWGTDTTGYGIGVVLQGGGQTVIGGGEGGTTFNTNSGVQSTENVIVSSDQNVRLFTNAQNGWENRKEWNFASDGYLHFPRAKFPNGYNMLSVRDGGTAHDDYMMIQNIVATVTINASTNAYEDVTFPVAFTSAPIWILATPINSQSFAWGASIYSPSTTGCRVYLRHLDAISSTVNIEVQIVACGKRY